MILKELARRLKKQAGRNPLVNRSAAMRSKALEALDELGITEGEDIREFFLNYRMDAIVPISNFRRQLLDVCEPGKRVLRATRFAREMYGLSDDFVCLDTAEGEGYIVYSKKTRSIYKGGIPEVRALNEERSPPTWDTFFDMLLEYVA